MYHNLIIARFSTFFNTFICNVIYLCNEYIQRQNKDGMYKLYEQDVTSSFNNVIFESLLSFPIT